MARPRDDRNPPMAEPARRAEGASTGGVLRNADGGLADSLQRSAERGDDDATGAATTGEALSGGSEPRLDLGGKNEPGSAAGARVPARSGSAPAAPRRGEKSSAPTERDGNRKPSSPAGAGDAEPHDEGPLESLGRAIAEPLAGADDPGVPGKSTERKR